MALFATGHLWTFVIAAMYVASFAVEAQSPKNTNAPDCTSFFAV